MRLVAPAICLSLCLVACGDSNDVPANFSNQCALTGESYDAFYEADGPYCDDPNGGEGSYCFPGDRCLPDGSCEFVTSGSGQGYCGLIGAVYDAFYEADGPYCDDPNGGEGSYCMQGDRCRTDGYCEAVLSADGDQPHAALHGMRYTAFYEADGAYCRSPNEDDEGSYCFRGDYCRADGDCEIVLSTRGGQLDEAKIGQVYDAFYEANGPYCRSPNEDEEGSYCFAGDLCRPDGMCQVVASARM